MNTLLVLGIAHTLGDYYLQPDSLAKRKEQGWGWLALHAALYAAAMALAFLCAGWAALPAWALLSLSHWTVDAARIGLKRRLTDPKAELLLFCADQALHLAAILLCWKLFLRGVSTPLFNALSGTAWFRPALAYAAMLCVLWKPSAILVRLALRTVPQTSDASDDPGSAPSVGALIGKLERVIVAVLYLCGAATAIGFVLTAKSIARFKKFEDQDFAERYLVGTLLSVALALMTVVFFSHLCL